MVQRLTGAVKRLHHDLDLWARAAVQGQDWEELRLRTLATLGELEEVLKQEGFSKRAREVTNLAQRLAGPIPDFTGAAQLIDQLSRLLLHAQMDQAA